MAKYILLISPGRVVIFLRLICFVFVLFCFFLFVCCCFLFCFFFFLFFFFVVVFCLSCKAVTDLKFRNQHFVQHSVV